MAGHSLTHRTSAPGRFLDRAIAGGVMLAVIFTALALGTVEAWSVALFELIITVLLLLWAAKAAVEKKVGVKIPSAALPLAGLVALGLIQSVAPGGNDTHSLSMDVEATRGAVAAIFFLLVAFLISANFFATRERLIKLANFLIVFGLVLAVFALVQHFTWEGRLFWFRPSPSAGMGGPFVNRNHFAGYMEMLIPMAVAFTLSRAFRGEARLLYGFAAAIMGIAEAASLSRGGMVSLIAALLFLAAVSTRMKRKRGSRMEDGESRIDERGSRIEDRASIVDSRFTIHDSRSSIFELRSSVLVLLIAAAIIAGIFWVGADTGLAERLAGSQGQPGPASRSAIWAGAWMMFRAHPLVGVGFGAFETVYPIYGRGDGLSLIQFAHNDYLQALSDGGIVAGALAVWFIIVTFRRFAGGLRLTDPLLRAAMLGAGAGVFAILVHSLFDFNLQIPSNALLFLVLVAMVANTAKGEEPRAKGQRAKRE
jgi:O-antigen ligase